MSKTLVIILSETRAHELTFNNFKKNVIDVLDADLCLCIGVKPDYDYNNPFYKLAKHKFLYNEPANFGDAFDYAYKILSKNRPKYEKLENTTTLYGKIRYPTQIKTNIKYYGKNININTNYDDDEIVVHKNNYSNKIWKNTVHGIVKSDTVRLFNDKNVVTYKKPLHWRNFLKIKDQFLGGIKDKNNQHPGSAGILIFFRWFLLKNLIETDLINKYDRFIVTRSDFIYKLPHPKVEFMDKTKIWIPDCEHYGGYTDRHVVLSQQNIVQYLNILNNLVKRSNEYFFKMKQKSNKWNLEKLIKFHLTRNNVLHLVKEFPYVMYSVRSINGTTRWGKGKFSKNLGYCIKYNSEYVKSSFYKKEFKNSGLKINLFYKNHIWNYNPNKNRLVDTTPSIMKNETNYQFLNEPVADKNNKIAILENTDDALDDVLDDTVDDVPDDVLDDAVDDVPDDVLDDAVDDILDNTVDDVLDDAVDDVPDDAADDVPDDVLDDILDDAVDDILDDTVDDVLDDAVDDDDDDAVENILDDTLENTDDVLDVSVF